MNTHVATMVSRSSLKGFVALRNAFLDFKRVLQESEPSPQAIEKGTEAELEAEPKSGAEQGEEEKPKAPRLEEFCMGL